MKISCILFVALSILRVSSDEIKKPGSLVAIDSDGSSGNNDEAVIHSFTEEGDLEEFEPTSEWQDINPHQAIPRGLHVQINLQTGRKQAKLMDGDDGSRFFNHEKTKYSRKQNQPNKKLFQIDQNMFSKQHLKDALKDFKDKFHDDKSDGDETDRSTVSEKFRSIEKIRKDMEDANLFVKKDIEFIQEYVKILNNSFSSLDEKEYALNELEYYLHQTDNAVDFDTIGGLALVIQLLNSTEERLVATAAYVLGSASQSNLPVQEATQSYGALPILLRLLLHHNSEKVRRKAFYALSSVIRLCSKAQQELLNLNGLEVFLKLLSEPGTSSLKVKAITLTTDILTEQFDLVKQQAAKQGATHMEPILQQIPLLKAMVKQGWCKLVPNLLNTTENDTREKVLHALSVMAIGCKDEFKNSNVFNSIDNLQAEWQNVVKEVGRDDAEYFVQLLQLASDLKRKLN